MTIEGKRYVRDFLDPPSAQFDGDSLLERVSRAYEEATDAYGDACDAAAIAENAFLLAHSKAWVNAVEDRVAATVRDKHCKAQKDVCEALMDFNRAAATEKRCKAKTQELSARMMAAMSHQRMVREQT